MNIKLYNTADESNKVDKTLSLVADTDVNLLATAQQSDFNITLSGSIVGANYLYVPAWGRYYFLDSPVIQRNGLTEYHAHVDVLMTYKAQLRQETGVILRQENKGNLYIADNNFPVEAKNKIFFKEFPQGFDTGLTYYLTVGG